MSVATVNYTQMSERVRDVLKEAFGPNVAIRTDEGQFGHVFVKIVSDRFDDMPEREKQEVIWNLLQQKLGEDAHAIAIVLALGMDQV